MSDTMTIKILPSCRWGEHTEGDIIDVDKGVGNTLIHLGKAKAWNGINKKLIKNRPANKLYKAQSNK